jgi:signal transduction histidine kinase
MKRSLHITLLLLQSFLAVICSGREVLNQFQFEELVDHLNALNRENPARVAVEAAPALAFVDRHDSLRNRILLETALAPYDFLKRGYRNARHKLIKLLGPAIDSNQSGELVPLLRLAIADLARRNGEVRYGFNQMIDALKWVDGETSAEIRLRLLDEVARLNRSARLPAAALETLEHMAGFGNLDGFPDPLQLALRKARLHLVANQYEQLNTALAAVPDRFTSATHPRLIAEYWILHAWHSLATASPRQAGDYLDQAGKAMAGTPSPRLIAELKLLEAVLYKLNGSPEAVVEASLQAAESAYTAAAIPGRLGEALIQVVRIFGRQRMQDVPGGVLRALTKFTRNEENLLGYAEGMAAWAELLRRDGMATEALHKQQISTRRLRQFQARMDQLQTAWDRRSREVLFSFNPSWEVSVFYYILLTLLLLVIVLLLLSLKIWTQRHLNRRLADSVEKARYAEQAAEASNRLKSQFLANVSHELKTPMSGLVGMASLLDELLTDPMQRKYLATIRTCSENLVVLLNDLLDLGRIESGVLEVENKEFSPDSMIGHSLDLVTESASRKGLEMHLELGNGIPQTLIGDPIRIGQVLTNLLHNAIKFTESGSVALRADFERTIGTSGNLRIAIHDTGIGIAAEDLHTLFEPFNRLRSEGGRDSDGSGLGLAICKKLVELMGGSISARSEPGKGSCFTVLIPVKAGPA